MKKTVLNCAVLGVLALGFSGCATIINNHEIVTLYHYQKNAKIKENGKDVELTQGFAAHKKAGYAAYTAGSDGTNYYIPAMKLSAKPKVHTINIEQDGKTATVKVKGKVSGLFVICDLFLGGPIGIIIDATTGKWRVPNKHYIDVTAATGQTKTISRQKLKNEVVKANR